MPTKTAENMTTRNAHIATRSEGPVSMDAETRTVDVVLATEAPATVFDFERFDFVDEVLLMSGARFPAQVPFLDAHNRYSVESQIGSLRNLRIEGAELLARAHFSSADETAFTKVREGHVTDVSVGYRVRKSVWVPEGQTAAVDGRTWTGPIKIVTEWEVKEGSLVPIGADEYAKIRSQHQPEVSPMPEEQKPQVRAAEPASEPSAPVAPAASRNETAPEVQDSRAADIADLAMRHGHPDLISTAIRENWSVERFRSRLLDLYAEGDARGVPANAVVTVGEGEEEKFRSAATDALLLRSGVLSMGKRRETAPGAEELRGYSLKEMARECLRRAGKRTSGDMDMVGRAFTSTSDFPALLADAAHQSVLLGFETSPETYEVWTGEASAVDFREHTGVSLEGFSSLNLVREGAEYTYGSFGETGVSYSIGTYGKMFAITRQAIINDQLGLFTDVPAEMGRAANRTVGNLVYGFLIDNPKLADGKKLFDASRGNVAETGSDISVASFGAGVTAMGTHKNRQGETLNIRPAYLITPIALQAKTYQLLNATVIGTQAEPGVPNPWVNAVVPVPEGRLDGLSALPWFLAAQKGQFINVAFLGGNRSPRVEQRTAWTIDGVEFKISMDMGVFARDPRGGYKNEGVSAGE